MIFGMITLFINICAVRKKKGKSIIIVSSSFLIVVAIGAIVLYRNGFLERFVIQGSNSNGRSYLIQCGIQTIRNASFTEMIFGGKESI